MTEAWDGYRTLLEPTDPDWLPDDRIPVVPDVKRVVAKKGDLTWDIDSNISFGDGQMVVPFQREAVVGEYIRDVEMRFVLDIRDNLIFRQKVRSACEGNKQAQDFQRLLCKNSIHYYCNTWCWTFHPGKEAQPFIAFDIQKAILSWFVWTYKLRLSAALEKSREGGASWLMMIGLDWVSMLYNNQNTFTLSMTEPEVDNRTQDSLMGKSRYLIEFRPEWFKGGWVEKGNGIDLKMFMAFPETRSKINGKLTGGKSGRGGRANAAVFDEFAHVEDAQEAIEASSSLAFAKIFVSTVKGKKNAFARITHSPGAILFRHNGKRGFHWSEDLRKDGKWSIRERARPEYTDEVWAQEQEIQYETSTSGRVYPRFLSFPHKDTKWCHISDETWADKEDGYPVEVFMDYGISKPNPNIALFAQIKRVPIDYDNYATEMLVIFDEMFAINQSAEELVAFLKNQPHRYNRFIGDMYTAQQRDRVYKEMLSIQQYMRQQGINLIGKRNGDSVPILEVKRLLERPGSFVIHKRCAVTIESMQQWSYPTDKDTGTPVPGSKPNHDQYSHANKALSYGVDWIYGKSVTDEEEKLEEWNSNMMHKKSRVMRMPLKRRRR